MLIAFILSSAASCGPSPLGGIGGIGEGNLGLRHGISAIPMQFGIILGVPIAALIVAYMGLSVEFLRINETVLSLLLGSRHQASLRTCCSATVFISLAGSWGESLWADFLW